MARIKTGLVEAVREEQQQAEEQSKLHKKHNVQDENVIVVEKTNTFKFIIKAVYLAVRVIAILILLALAAIGLLAIIYPESRGVLIESLSGTFVQLKNYIEV